MLNIVTNEQFLDVVRGVSIFLALPLMIISLMALGKHFSDLLYQRAKGLNGIRWIQSFINIRIHSNRVFFAFAFFTTSILNLAEVDPVIRAWIGVLLFLGVLTSFLISAIMDWFAEAKQLEELLKYEEVNRIPEMRLNLHRVQNRLMALYGYIELHATVDEKTSAEIVILQEELKLLVKSVQMDLHAMDPSYREEKKEAIQ